MEKCLREKLNNKIHSFKEAKRHLGFPQAQAVTFASQPNMGLRTYCVGCGELCEPHH
jgi:hypothetical protein